MDMAASLPVELLNEIVGYLQQTGASLVACAGVCRRWQAVFGPIVYSELSIYSDDSISKKKKHWAGISLKQFQEFTSGPGIIRRAWFRQVRYQIVVPFYLKDWMTREDEGYSVDNAVRRANDTAFQSAVIGLFNVLEAWEETNRLSVSLEILGCERGQEPHVTEDDEAAYNNWSTEGSSPAVPVYRARFHQDAALQLRDVPCIDKLLVDIYEHQIWAGAAMEIALHCPTLTELSLDFNEYIRPDHLHYLKGRRQAVSEGLKDISPSLRVFRFGIQEERNWKDVLPPLNVLSSSIDTLSIEIRNLSLSLCELELAQLPMTLDFLWPLDEKDHSLPGNTSLHWPNLEILTLKECPPWLPSGEWIVQPDAKEAAELAQIEDLRAEVLSYERNCWTRDILKQEQFHRLFISLGYAARRMPRLRSINFDLSHYNYLYFKFLNRTNSIRLEWEVGNPDSYKPDDRVAAAWGFRLDDQQPSEWEYHAALSHWPPVESKST